MNFIIANSLCLFKTEISPQMRNFFIILIAIAVVLLLIVFFGSGKSRVRRGVSMFLAENENERRQYSNPHNNHSQQQKQSKQRQLTPGEAYYEMDNDHQKYSMNNQIEMVTLIRKSDDRY